MTAHESTSERATDRRSASMAARDIVVTYGAVRAVDNADIEVLPGELCGLIGPNGAGKTTLFDVISGHRTPTTGSVHIGGLDVTNRGPLWRARHGVRRTFQRQQIFGALTVEQNIRAALDWRGGDGGFLRDVVGLRVGRAVEAERQSLVDAALEMCGLVEVRREYAGNLPIGAARMVELARALVDRPQLLLLDEPSSGLSREQTDRLGSIIEQFRAETGCACLLVEHDVPFVMAHCDRVVVLDLGRVISNGTPSEVQADPCVRAAYLG